MDPGVILKLYYFNMWLYISVFFSITIFIPMYSGRNNQSLTSVQLIGGILGSGGTRSGADLALVKAKGSPRPQRALDGEPFAFY